MYNNHALLTCFSLILTFIHILQLVVLDTLTVAVLSIAAVRQFVKGERWLTTKIVTINNKALDYCKILTRFRYERLMCSCQYNVVFRC